MFYFVHEHFSLFPHFLYLYFIFPPFSCLLALLCFPQVTALHLAARFSSAAVVKVILEAGSEDQVEKRTTTKDTPLHLAASVNVNVDVIKLLVEFGADIDARNQWLETPLHGAAWENSSPAVIKTLIILGASLSAQASSGRTPLHRAAAHNPSVDVVRVLIKCSADSQTGETDTDVETSLIEYSSEVDALDNWQQTPLHLAAQYNPGALPALLEKGKPKVDPLDNKQKTPLYYAKVNGHETAIQALCEAGADQDICDLI